MQWASLAVYISLLTLGLSFLSAPLFAMLIRLFPVNVRYTGVSFVFNTAIACFSSTTPLLLLEICQHTPHISVSAMYIALFGFIAFFIKVLQ